MTNLSTVETLPSAAQPTAAPLPTVSWPTFDSGLRAWVAAHPEAQRAEASRGAFLLAYAVRDFWLHGAELRAWALGHLGWYAVNSGAGSVNDLRDRVYSDFYKLSGAVRP